MDVFAFASQTETQGLVLSEAMTAGVPVVALDAPGAREVVQDGRNGRLLPEEKEEAFVPALRWVAEAPASKYRSLVRLARATAREFSLERCAGRLLDLYNHLLQTGRRSHREEDNPWKQTVGLVEAEWNLWSARVGAVVKAILSTCL
jgi:glycosyltransferase involved in cell wall biosynthesis